MVVTSYSSDVCKWLKSSKVQVVELWYFLYMYLIHDGSILLIISCFRWKVMSITFQLLVNVENTCMSATILYLTLNIYIHLLAINILCRASVFIYAFQLVNARSISKLNSYILQYYIFCINSYECQTIKTKNFEKHKNAKI